MTALGTEKLVRTVETMDGAKYSEIVIQRYETVISFRQVNDPQHTAKARLEWFKGKRLNVLGWPHPPKNLWNDFKIAVHQQSPSDLKELEHFYCEEWATIPVAQCAKLMVIHTLRDP